MRVKITVKITSNHVKSSFILASPSLHLSFCAPFSQFICGQNNLQREVILSLQPFEEEGQPYRGVWPVPCSLPLVDLDGQPVLGLHCS